MAGSSENPPRKSLSVRIPRFRTDDDHIAASAIRKRRRRQFADDLAEKTRPQITQPGSVRTLPWWYRCPFSDRNPDLDAHARLDQKALQRGDGLCKASPEAVAIDELRSVFSQENFMVVLLFFLFYLSERKNRIYF
jgi:hypothetical protein